MDREFSEKTCLCALNRLLGFEPRAAHAIVDALGSAGRAFRLGQEEKTALLGPFSRIAPLLTVRELCQSEDELRRLEDSGCRFITYEDPGYPSLLKECPDAPLGLYFRGTSPPEEVFNRGPQIAVVGTRDMSLYGREWCRKAVRAMASTESRPMIVSGFAMGVDITAHLAAMEAGLPTVAVLPTGIDAVYPWRHSGVASTLASTRGCALVTDYPPGTEPKAVNFIRRNRIIAGSCSGTILIESKLKGGGMITARLAVSYDRDLVVLPGRADDLRSMGCNLLLKEKLAEPLTDTVHFLDVLGLGTPSQRLKKQNIETRVRTAFSGRLGKEDLEGVAKVATAVRASRGITTEEICSGTGLPAGNVLRYVGLLESEGFISVDLLQRCTVEDRTV